jgi:hypothetical protein
MKTQLGIIFGISMFLMSGCGGSFVNQKLSNDGSIKKTERYKNGIKVSSENYLGYQPIAPAPASKVKIYNSETKRMKEVFWESLTDTEHKRRLLPLQTAQFSMRRINASGQVTYLVSSLSAEVGSYEVIMDYMKYRVEDAYGEDGDYIGNSRVGVGLRIKALVDTKKSDLNLGSITAIGLQASIGNISGGISVDVIGIDSESVTNLIPLTSKIDETAIQSALQALASIKSKLWETDITITPHVVAISQSKPNQNANIRKQISTFMKSKAGDVLRRFWKPDGQNINNENEKILKEWMSLNGLCVEPGTLTMFLRGGEFESIRNKAVRELKLN